MKSISNYIPQRIPAQKQTDTISVVVPIYNVEKYLPRAIDSILCQTYQNLEVILVDDGSTDGSPKICDRYAGQDSRVKVLHKANGGPGSARNRGMALATGKYLTFADGDDWLEQDMYEAMLSAIRETASEMAICRIQFNYLDQVRDDSTGTASIFHGAELLEAYIERNAGFIDSRLIIDHGACNKLYERSLAKGLSFSTDLCGEEVRFTTRLLSRVQKSVYLDTAYYHYFRDRPDSLTHIEFTFDLFEKDLSMRNDKSAFLREIKRDDLADMNDFFLYEHLLYSYLEARTLSLSEMRLRRSRIEQTIQENRAHVVNVYLLPKIHFKKRIRMKAFLISPPLFLMISKIHNTLRGKRI